VAVTIPATEAPDAGTSVAGIVGGTLTLLVAGSRLASTRVERRRGGQVLSLVAAGALIFLGLLDVSFNVQQGMYSGALWDALLAGAINTWCIGFGLFVIIRCRRLD